MNIFTPFFILSAETDIHTLNENAYRTGMLSRKLRKEGFAVATCKGVYEGREEKSLLVIDETPSVDDCFNAVIRLARTYAQKTVLAVDANRIGHLVNVADGKQISKRGKFRDVTKEVALASQNYTVRAGRYYVCA